MRLVHYSDAPLGKLHGRAQGDGDDLGEFTKPRGLWLSADDYENSWREWCIGERFGLDKLTHVHDVRLKKHAPVLFLHGASDLDRFSKTFGRQSGRTTFSWIGIVWTQVASEYQGIIIAPYVWSRRMSMEGSTWYYGWDCASGCIWDPAAIAAVTLREIVPVPEPEDEAA